MRALLKVLVACGACALGVGIASWSGKVRGDWAYSYTCDFATCTGTYPGFYYDDASNAWEVYCPLGQQSTQFLECRPNLDYDCGYDPSDGKFCVGVVDVGTPDYPIFKACYVRFQRCNSVSPHP